MQTVGNFKIIGIYKIYLRCYFLRNPPLWLYANLFWKMNNFLFWKWRRTGNIPIYIQQDATLHSLLISGNFSTRFGWYHPKHVEQFPDMNKLCNVASCWIYIGIYLRSTDP